MRYSIYALKRDDELRQSGEKDRIDDKNRLHHQAPLAKHST